jgi:4'-phosphopantetheinyl transferase
VISAQRVAGELTEDEVHVWKLDLRLPAKGLARLKSLLSRDELGRMEELSHPLHRSRSIAARGRLRELMASYTDQAPAEIEFEYGNYGKPYLKSAGPSSGVSFNLSHSKDVVLLAITRRREVGVDIEYIKPGRNYLAVAQFYFSERERSQLAALPERARQEAFFHGWARKEAFIKALGLGLAFPLDDFSVSVHPEAAGLLEVRGEQQAAARWQVIKLQVDGPFTAALAVEAGISDVRFFEGE